MNNDTAPGQPTEPDHSSTYPRERSRTILKIAIRRGRETHRPARLQALTARTRAIAARIARLPACARARLHRSGWLDATRMSGAITAGLIASGLFYLITELLQHLLT